MVSNEFELIERWFTRTPSRKDVSLGVGDDAAVLDVPADHQLVVTVDTLISGVHFPVDTEARAIGHKSIAVNLSDLAAMGAEPVWVTLALTLPQADAIWLEAFSEGFFSQADRYGVSLIGGDTTRGALSITVQAGGWVPTGQALRRNGARPGDVVCVTGTLGDAALGLAWRQGRRILDERAAGVMQGRLDCPRARVEAGLALRGLASAAIDVSDGLAADLSHVLAASGVGATIDVEALPLSAAVAVQPDAVDLALTGGDDYELLFTASPAEMLLIEARLRSMGLRCSRIGRVESRAGLRLIDGAGHPRQPGAIAGYDHFREKA